MADKFQIEKRKRKVLELMLQGATEEEMASALDVTRKTIVKDKKRLKKELSKELEKNPKDYIIENYFMQNKKIITEAWKLYRTGTEPTKTKALNIITKSSENFVDNLMKIGLLEPVANKLEIKAELSKDDIIRAYLNNDDSEDEPEKTD